MKVHGAESANTSTKTLVLTNFPRNKQWAIFEETTVSFKIRQKWNKVLLFIIGELWSFQGIRSMQLRTDNIEAVVSHFWVNDLGLTMIVFILERAILCNLSWQFFIIGFIRRMFWGVSWFNLMLTLLSKKLSFAFFSEEVKFCSWMEFACSEWQQGHLELH